MNFSGTRIHCSIHFHTQWQMLNMWRCKFVGDNSYYWLYLFQCVLCLPYNFGYSEHKDGAPACDEGTCRPDTKQERESVSHLVTIGFHGQHSNIPFLELFHKV